MEPGTEQVALVTLKQASRPVLIRMESRMPHLGLMVEETIDAQVLVLEASVHARKRSFMVNDWPHLYPILSNSKVVIKLGDKGPPQPLIGVEEERLPSLLRITKVPQNAKAVLFEPVVLLIDKFKVLYTESPVVH